ncbi:MAG: lytic transglycosylase domain-containing protein [Limisphaerales bacterium]
MNRRQFLGFTAGAVTGAVRAADDAPVLDFRGLVEEGRRFLEEELPADWLEQLPEADEEKIRDLLQRIEAGLAGDYVVDLAALRDGARTLLPLLDTFPESRPYSDWLRSRMDYFDVAEELRVRVGAPPSPPPVPRSTNAPPALPPARPVPTLEVEREVWRRRIERRPEPAGAAALARQLRPVFTGNGVPGALVWVAEVESSFKPEARSPAGAVGLFQLMPATAKAMGLSLAPRDERLVPRRNAEGAARYLRYLFNRFRDWPLTLAAYNAGEGRVNGLLRETRGRRFEDIRRRLPAETQMYVPKVDAVLQRREGVALARLPAVRQG